MKLFHVEIKGEQPLLMHAMPPILLRQQKNIRKEQGSPEEEAEKAAYRDKDGFLVVPAVNIMACLIQAARPVTKKFVIRGAGFKAPDVIKGSVRVEPNAPRLLDLNGRPIKDYEVDAKWVRNPSTGGKMASFRPRIDEWMMKFDLKWNELIFAVGPDLVKETVRQAAHVGLCDYRPMYGIFSVQKLEVEDL
jgi:hypothetical protein